MNSVADAVRRPITSKQFTSALRNVLSFRSALAVPKMGLAISGGVDSMALLLLWSQFMNEYGLDARTKCRVFVVDHKARQNSTDEAHRVTNHIKQLTNLSAEVLTLDWENENPHSPSNFESIARKLRYRALGRACRREGIDKLMLGHHGEDSMETMLSRIATRHFGNALAGIAPVAQLPEVVGEYGIYESGSPIGLAPSGRVHPWCCESGGVSILRPLLSYSKKDLIDTCEANGVTWFEDATNHDPKFTQRNAIRSIVNAKVLPNALSLDRLRSMTATVNSNRDKVEKQRDEYLSKCIVQTLDLRSGKLRILLPRLGSVFPAIGASDSSDQKYSLCCAIVAYILDLVSPEETINKNQLGPIVNAMFESEFTELSAALRVKSGFMTAGINLVPVDIQPQINRLKRRPPGVKTPPAIHSLIKQLSQASDRGFSLWQLSRADPVKNVRFPAILLASPRKGITDADLITDQSRPLNIMTPDQGEFTLWDGRFWIRIMSSDVDHELLITAPTDQALEDLSRAFGAASRPGDASRRITETMLHDLRSAKSLFSIPAIVVPPGVPSIEPGFIVALPTYGLVHPDYRGRIEWDIHYKRIDIEPLNLVNRTKDPYILRTPY